MFFFKDWFFIFFSKQEKNSQELKRGGGLAIIMDFFIVFIWGKVLAAQIKKIVWIF